MTEMSEIYHMISRKIHFNAFSAVQLLDKYSLTSNINSSFNYEYLLHILILTHKWPLHIL